MRLNLPKNTPNCPLPSTPRHSWIAVLYLLCLLLAATVLWAQPASREIQVFASSELQPVLPALGEAFTHATGIKLLIHYGTSAELAAQLIKNDSAAPADLFLAADYSLPEQVVAANLADTSAPIPYARGALVLWARKDSPAQPLTQDTLHDGHFTVLAIAKPDRTPYGRAAAASLTWMKIYDKLKPHVVLTEDDLQAAQLAESGDAQVALIPLTLATTDHFKQLGSYVRIPRSAYPQIRQCAVVLRAAPHRSDAHAFLDWLRSSPIQQALSKYNLDPVP